MVDGGGGLVADPPPVELVGVSVGRLLLEEGVVTLFALELVTGDDDDGGVVVFDVTVLVLSPSGPPVPSVEDVEEEEEVGGS